MCPESVSVSVLDAAADGSAEMSASNGAGNPFAGIATPPTAIKRIKMMFDSASTASVRSVPAIKRPSPPKAHVARIHTGIDHRISLAVGRHPSATGLLSPDGGEVQLLGADPLTHDAETRARVGVMLQDGGLTSGATPAQLLAYASSLYARPRDWRALSRELGIDSFSSTLVRRLSGGQRQRLSLALSLLGVPDVLFLDEPTAGMDVAVKRRTRELIRAEAERGAAVILTSHALDDIASLADRVIVIAEGCVKADGTLADVERTLGSQSPLSIDIAASAPSEERLVAFEQAVRNAAEIQGITLAIEHVPDSLEDILVSLSNTRAKETK